VSYDVMECYLDYFCFERLLQYHPYYLY